MNILDLILFLIPPYLANSTPVVFGGGATIDMNKRWSDGRRIFGKSKTIKGFISGVLFGTIGGILIALVYPISYFPNENAQMIGSFLLSLGTMCGDLMGSFIKRRINVQEGKQFVLDSWLFIVIAIIFTIPVLTKEFYDPLGLGIILILTVILHPLTNRIANALGIKKVPW